MKNEIKLVCLDLDGTLLTSKKEIDNETIEYLRKLSSNGVNIAIATGRAAFDSKYHAKLIDEEAYFLGSNGSAVGSVEKKTLLFEECMDIYGIKRICDVATKLEINPIFYTKNYIIFTGLKELLLHHYFSFKSGNKKFRHIKIVFGKKNFLKKYYSNKWDIEKCIFFIHDNKKVIDAENMLDDDLFEIALTSKECLEISKKGVNKSYGIRKLAKYLNISKDEIIAFGDSENDREMLKFVGKGIAMGNSPKTIKEIADEVTESNDEFGVLLKLKEIFDL